MAQTSWPFENIDTSETQFSLWARNLGQGVLAGKLNELESSADGSGMTIKVESGQALVRGHFYDSTSEETLTIAAANVSNPRVDAVVLRLDPTANSILLTVIEGTPATSPVLPALTQTDGGVYDLLIASVNVPAAAVVIAAENVNDERTLFTAWSGQLPNALVTTKTVNYTLAPGDNQNLLQVNGSYTLTVPANIFATGSRVDVANIGTGTVTFAEGSGMTLNSKDDKLTIDTQYSAATVFFTSATTALLVGDLA
jgi:hypothetical protein